MRTLRPLCIAAFATLFVAACATPPAPPSAPPEAQNEAASAPPAQATSPAPLAPPVAIAPQPADPLPSWNGGPTKRALVSFVTRVTNAGGAEFVPVPERIAVFDNDGTLWSEQPMYIQLAFTLDRIRELAPRHPEWKNKQPFKAVLAGDMKTALAGGNRSLGELVTATHAGMTSTEFEAIVEGWFKTAKHPKYGRLYTDCVYQPMLEVLGYLRANAFKTFIVSGGGIDFMRPITEKAYGIPPEQVVGSAGALKYEVRDGKPVIARMPGIAFIDDGPGKPVGIQNHIGRRPIAAFGNSDGDLQMLEWTAAGTGPRLMLIVHHTDPTREVAYDRESHIGKLDKALDAARANGWLVASMKDDWKTIFPAP
jgi:hypothetical protein